MKKISYKGVPVPPEIIQQAIWLYVRFTLSFRDVEDLLAERGRTVVSSVIVSDDGSEYVMVALDSGETVTGLLASKWEPQQGPPRHPKSRPLISLLMRRPRKNPSLVVFCLIFAVSPGSEVF
jgi:hypothetical protein